jgi:hypothetical protein
MSDQKFAFFKASEFFKEMTLDEQMTNQVKCIDVLESLLHIQTLNKSNILEPLKILDEGIFKK